MQRDREKERDKGVGALGFTEKGVNSEVGIDGIYSFTNGEMKSSFFSRWCCCCSCLGWIGGTTPVL